MAGLYDIISELRREYPTQGGARALDMVVAELGRTQDNLLEAMARIEHQPLPAGSEPVLEELSARASAEGVDDVRIPLPPDEVRANTEPITAAQVGIAALLGGTAVLGVALAAVAIVTVFVHG